MRLSDRLETVVSMVRPAESAADIGTDHGHVPVELVRRGTVKRALAMDVRKGPLSRAEESVAMAGLENRIETRLSDGLEKLSPGEAEAVVIAGMGGELMIHILEQGRHMWDSVGRHMWDSVGQWILSPQSEIPKMRKWLWDNGFPVEKEEMVFEDGKFYTILSVGRKREDDRKERPERFFYYSQYLIDAKDPVFLKYLKEEEEKLCSLAESLGPLGAHSERAAAKKREAEEDLRYNREVQNEMQ